MFSNNRKSQAGFSLVELMVVVAIIGVLASIAVPSINKYLAKARQTEAKTQLSAVYTSSKAFYAEYTTYDPRFLAIGYSPEGQMRYNVGFSNCAVVATQASNGYSGNAPTTCAAKVYCAASGGLCSLLTGATGGPSPDLTAGAADSTTFTAQALARISSSATVDDTWTINETKLITNTVNGIP